MPASQSTQAVPDHFFPSPQVMHALTDVLPAGDIVPAAHAVQDSSSPVEYVPPSHVEHDEEPAVEYLPAPHEEQDVMMCSVAL